jgi:hypothetical protein
MEAAGPPYSERPDTFQPALRPCSYAANAKVDLVVMGSRGKGMGALKRSFMSFIGLGSASDHAAHHLHCALAVVKAGGQEPSAPAGVEEAQQEAAATAASAVPEGPAAAAAVAAGPAPKED